MRSRPLAVKAAGTSLAIAMGSARALGGSPSPADLLAPQALCDRYTDETYATMRDDEMRTRAYRSAIERHAPGKLCLDVGTGALALLAIIAARAGAEHVFAIEANAEAAAAARQTVAAEGLEAQITIIEGYSTDVTLPQRVDLLLHEIIGEIASAEGVVAAVLDAGERHLRSGAHPPVSIPARARTLLAPCEFPGSEYFDALPYPMLAAPGAQVLKLPSLPRSLMLAPAAPMEDLDFSAAAPVASHAHEMRFALARRGELRGLALHIELVVDGGVAGAAEGEVEAGPAAPEVSSAEPGSHWHNVMVLLETVEVEAGAQLLVRTTAELGAGAPPRYTFEAWLGGADDEAAPPEAMRWLGAATYP